MTDEEEFFDKVGAGIKTLQCHVCNCSLNGLISSYFTEGVRYDHCGNCHRNWLIRPRWGRESHKWWTWIASGKPPSGKR